jgi:eukaryotic-like serine/threonine-protein kinase
MPGRLQRGAGLRQLGLEPEQRRGRAPEQPQAGEFGARGTGRGRLPQLADDVDADDSDDAADEDGHDAQEHNADEHDADELDGDIDDSVDHDRNGHIDRTCNHNDRRGYYYQRRCRVDGDGYESEYRRLWGSTDAKRQRTMTSTTMIAGRYRIEGRLGVGGMSTVQLAFDQRLERYVAVKLLAEHLADDPTFVSRFRREALAAARLVHPNIVQVFDFGFDENQHQHFIVMEHVSGNSCAELLREHGHLNVEVAVEIVSQACRGLDYAHRNGVVHRDVKPGNLLVSDADVVKLADFGIARATDQSSITQVGSVLGTAAYLAPEQARGEEAGPRADLYSLGVVTYQLLSGRLPYEATSLSELALKQQREAPLPLHELNPNVPLPLARAVALALAIEPEHRPANAIKFAEALSDGLEGRMPAGGELPPSPGTAATRVIGHDDETAATQIAPRAGRQQRPARATPPRQVPARRPAQVGADRITQAQSPSRGNRAARRFFAFLAIAIVLIVIIIVTAVVSTNNSSTVLHLKTVVSHDAQSLISSARSIINSNIG